MYLILKETFNESSVIPLKLSALSHFFKKIRLPLLTNKQLKCIFDECCALTSGV